MERRISLKRMVLYVVFLGLIGWGLYSLIPEPTITKVRVYEPKPNEIVTSPLEIRGEAIGPWFFEANFPIKIYDDEGTILGESYATAQGEWMTEHFVPFTAEIEFSTMGAVLGELVLEKQNASGLPEHADDYRIPVQFEPQELVNINSIQLYYYNPELDKDKTGNILCTGGLVPVNRNLPVTNTPIQDTIRLLINGQITETEKESGVETEYPLDGFNLMGANLEEGKLTLEFEDPNYKTNGGSCRVNVLRSQIEQTALQFDEVNSVVIKPEFLFQP